MISQEVYVKGFFEVKVDFIDQNLHQIEHHFNHLIDTCEEVIISLWNVDKIDSTGLSLMTKLYEKAMKEGKTLFFHGCKRMEVNTHYIKGKLHFIFNDDLN